MNTKGIMTSEKSQSQRLHIVWFHLLSSKWLDYGGGDERDGDGENGDEWERGWVWIWKNSVREFLNVLKQFCIQSWCCYMNIYKGSNCIDLHTCTHTQWKHSVPIRLLKSHCLQSWSLFTTTKPVSISWFHCYTAIVKDVIMIGS